MFLTEKKVQPWREKKEREKKKEKTQHWVASIWLPGLPPPPPPPPLVADGILNSDWLLPLGMGGEEGKSAVYGNGSAIMEKLASLALLLFPSLSPVCGKLWLKSGWDRHEGVWRLQSFKLILMGQILAGGVYRKLWIDTLFSRRRESDRDSCVHVCNVEMMRKKKWNLMQYQFHYHVINSKLLGLL